MIDVDGNDLHGIPILSQLRPKVTSHIINYAEDFVILCNRKTAEAQAQTARIMNKLQQKSVGVVRMDPRQIPRSAFSILSPC